MPITMTQAPPPRSARAAQPVTSSRQAKRDGRAEAVNGLFQLAQFGCVMTGQYADAAAVGIHGEKISGEVVKLANQNERIAKAVDYLNEVGPYAGLITAVMPFVLQILANHKRIPADKVPGVSDPEVLTIQMQAGLAKQAAEARREADREFQEAQRIIAESEAQRSPNGSQSLTDDEGHPIRPDGSLVNS
jgi:hypothetical protein